MNTPIKKKDVEAHLKVWLLQGKEITHNEAQKKWGTNRLAEYIRRLRANGMKIEMTMTNSNGDIFGVYRLKETPKESRISNRDYLEQAYPKGL
jgi:hypothetical protein